MNASSELLAVLRAAAQPASRGRVERWIARVSISWTAWSILSRLRSVEDLIAWLKAAAAQIGVQFAWALNLVFFALDRVAAAFHFLTHLIFIRVPFLDLIPPLYRDATIVCVMAVIPTAISLMRQGRMKWAMIRADGVEREFELNGGGDELITAIGTALGEKKEDVSSINVCKWLQGRKRRANDELARWGRDINRIQGLLDQYVRAAHFRVFSLRFYTSLVLAAALVYEAAYLYFGSGSTHGVVSAALVSACVAVAFALAFWVKSRVDRALAEREFVANAVVKVCALPVFERHSDALPNATSAQLRRVLKGAGQPVLSLNVGLVSQASVSNLNRVVLRSSGWLDFVRTMRVKLGTEAEAWLKALHENLQFRGDIGSINREIWLSQGRESVGEAIAAIDPLGPAVIHEMVVTTPTAATVAAIIRWLDHNEGPAADLDARIQAGRTFSAASGPSVDDAEIKLAPSEVH